jgi:hypothetical protein
VGVVAGLAGLLRGTGCQRPHANGLSPFDEAREFVWKVGLESHEQWKEWSRDAPRPINIRCGPRFTYADKE